MKLLILHLSDLHFDADTPELDNVKLNKLVQAAMSADSEIAAALTICTGDVCDKGCIKGMAGGFFFLWQLDELIKGYSSEVKHLGTFCTPGNHDTIRLDDQVIKACHVQLAQKDVLAADGLVEHVLGRQRDFFDLRQSIFPTSNETIDRLFQLHKIKVGDYTICLAEINSAVLCSGDNDKGHLSVHVPALDQNADLKLAFFHHPLSYLKDAVQKRLESSLGSWANLALCGHTHEQDSYSVKRNGRPLLTTFVASEFGSARGSCAHAIVADLQSKKISIHEIVRSEDGFEINSSTRNDLEYFTPVDPEWPTPKQKFINQLLECNFGARTFRGKSITIHDIFQYPSLKNITSSMREIAREEANSKYSYGSKSSLSGEDMHETSAESLVEIDDLDDITFIHGQERSGKSGLLAKLYSEMQRKGYVPLLLSRQSACKRLSGNEDIWQCLYCEQYDGQSKQSFAAIKKEKRVLLVDDLLSLDHSRVRPHDFLGRALQSFPRVIVTVGDVEGLKATLGRQATDVKASVSHLQILPVSGKQVRRFVTSISSGLNGGESEGMEELVRAVSEVLGDQLILPYAPTVARIILDVLSGVNIDILKGSLGSYYEYLVLEGIKDGYAKLSSGKTSAENLKRFLGEISVRLTESDDFIVTERTINEIVSSLKAELIQVNKDDAIRLAISSNLIRKATEAEMDSAFENQRGVGYKFVQRFHRHYFAGLWLKGQLASSQTRESARVRLDQCISTMHLRDSAEVVLFTMYQSEDEWLVNRLLEEGRKLVGIDGSCPLSTSFGETGDRSDLHEQSETSGPSFVHDDLVDPPYTVVTQNEQLEEGTNTYDIRLEQIIRLMSNACHFQFVYGQILKNYSSKLSREQLLEMGRAVPSLSQKLIKEFLDLIREDREEVDRLANHYLKVQLRQSRREVMQKFKDNPLLVFRERIFGLVVFGALRRGVNAMASHDLGLLHRELYKLIDKEEEQKDAHHDFVGKLVLMGAMLETDSFKADEVKALLTDRNLSPTGKQVGKVMVKFHVDYFTVSRAKRTKLLEIIGMDSGYPGALPLPGKANPKHSIIRRDEL